MLLATNITVKQEVMVTAIKIALFVFTRLWYTPQNTFNRSRAANCSKTPTPEISLQNLRAYKMLILSNSWATD